MDEAIDFDVYELVAGRLRDRCPALGQVETGMNATAAFEMMAMSAATVTALVSPLAETAIPIAEAGLRVSQTEVWRFGVTLGMAFPAGFAEFIPARGQVRSALRGWGPVWAAKPAEYAGGRLLQYSLSQAGGRWLWLLEFRLTLQDSYEHQA